MTLDQVLPDFRAGKHIRRASWGRGVDIRYRPAIGGQTPWAFHSCIGLNWSPTIEDFCADDWEIAALD